MVCAGCGHLLCNGLLTRICFCSCCVLRIQTHVPYFQVCKPLVQITELESGSYVCDLSLLHASDSPVGIKHCLLAALNPAPIHYRAFLLWARFLPNCFVYKAFAFCGGAFALACYSTRVIINNNDNKPSFFSPHLCNSLLAISH